MSSEGKQEENRGTRVRGVMVADVMVKSDALQPLSPPLNSLPLSLPLNSLPLSPPLNSLPLSPPTHLIQPRHQGLHRTHPEQPLHVAHHGLYPPLGVVLQPLLVGLAPSVGVGEASVGGAQGADSSEEVAGGVEGEGVGRWERAWLTILVILVHPCPCLCPCPCPCLSFSP